MNNFHISSLGYNNSFSTYKHHYKIQMSALFARPILYCLPL